MNMKVKNNPLKEKYGLWSAVIASVIMIFIIMLPSMLLNRGIFLVRGDYVDQYLPRLIKAKEILSTGAGTWDWFNFLGASYSKINILLTLNSICLLFPTGAIPYVVTYMHLIRFALIAFCVYSYLRYMVNENKTAFLGTLLYVFSSFTFINFEFMQFIEALWTFPLLLLSAEKMFRGGRYKHQLVLATFLSCTISFYFFVFSTISFSIYFLCRFFLAEEWQKKRKIKYFILAVVEYALGFLCAFFAFSHFLYRMSNSAGSAETLGQNISLFPLLFDNEFIARLFSFFVPAASNRFGSFGNSGWTSCGTYLPVFGISFAIAFLLKKGGQKWLKVLTIISIFLIVLPLFCTAYNLFSSHYTRYAYTVLMFLTLATITFYENYNEKIARKSVWIAIGSLLMLLCIYFTLDALFSDNVNVYYLMHGDKIQSETEAFLRTYILIAAFGFYLLLLGFVYCKPIQKRMFPILIAAITIYGCSYTCVNQISDFLLDYYPVSKLTLREQVDKYFFDIPQTGDNEAHRIDAGIQWRNYAYTARRPTISAFESMRNRYSHDICWHSDMMVNRVNVIPQAINNASRTLYGVKYYYNTGATDNLTIPEGFSFFKTDAGIDIYKNDAFIGMGFTYETFLSRSEFSSDHQLQEGRNYTDLMLNTLIVEDADVPFVKDILKPYTKDYVCTQRTSLENFNITSEGFTASFTSPKEEIVYIAVPYEPEGWTATINGKKAAFIKSNFGLIALKTEKGENLISFSYESPATKIGWTVSGCGLILLLAYLLICRKKKIWYE